MDLQNLRKWIQGELRTAKLAVKLGDEIAEKGFVGDPRWLEIGWGAETDFLGGEQNLPREFFDLEHFGDLAELIMRRHEELLRRKTAILSAA